MNKMERIKMVQAMEFIMRNLNDENHIFSWLAMGVADGDIEYGSFSTNEEDMEMIEWYTKDDNFADLMDSFAYIMHEATKDGIKHTFYCDGIASDAR